MQPDHGLLLGKGDDDHPQYLNEARLGDYLATNPPTPGAHTHLEADVTDLGNYAVVGHSHVEADISDLGNYSVVGHGHVEADISDLGNYSVVGHGHTEADISDLGNYSVVGHTHSYLPTSGGTISGSLTLTGQLNIAGNIVHNLAGNQVIAKQGSGDLYIRNDNTAGNIFLYTDDGAGTSRRRLYIDGNGPVYVYNQAGSIVWNMDLTTSGDIIYKLATGEASNTYVGWDTTNNRWLMEIGGVIVLRLSAAATRLPQVYTDTTATGVSNVMISSDGRLRRIVTPSAP